MFYVADFCLFEIQALVKNLVDYFVRCPNPEEGTVKLSKAIYKDTVFLWQNEAFRFFGESDAVYFSCDVIVCDVADYLGACGQRMCPHYGRRRRETSLDDSTEDTTEMATITSPMFVIFEGNAIFFGSSQIIILISYRVMFNFTINILFYRELIVKFRISLINPLTAKPLFKG